jgi:parallel beta-helix repeat protein
LSIFLHNVTSHWTYSSTSKLAENYIEIIFCECNILGRKIRRSLLEIDSEFGKKSGYGITHSINSLVWDSLSMEPKSTAFYTAVAISILAVLGAAVFPTLVQAVQATTQTDTQEEDSADQGAADDNSNGARSNQAAADDNSNDGGSDQTTQSETNDQRPQRDETTGSSESGSNNGANNGPVLASSDGMISCGEVITTDVTLQQDLSCPDDGVIIGEDGIVFNMNGHSITSSDGDDNSVDLTMDVGGNSGIKVADVDGVTILGLGQVTGFDTGIRFTGSHDAKVTDVTLRDNGIGALVDGSGAVYISKNSIDTNDYGVVSDSSNNGAISFNQIVSNADAGIVLLASDENVIAGNGVFGNGDTGIFLNDQSNGNTVDYNIVFGHTEADMNNANGMATNLNDNTYGENNKCGTSTPGGLC